MAKIKHPGIELSKLLLDKGISQREFASTINVAHPLLNNILNGSRNINVNFALSLEAANLKTASYWLKKQVEFSLELAKNDKEVIEKKEAIQTWDNLNNIVPLNFFKRQNDLQINSSEDIDKIFDIYQVTSLSKLEDKINQYSPAFFRRSSKFNENKNNVLAWSVLAEHKARHREVSKFSRVNEIKIIEELKKCFYKKDNVLAKSESILNKYGIKFFTLTDRPAKTPVEGKSFISGTNPAIVLSLKYKRLDNFAFTLFHELGHVFLHLTNPKRKSQYKNQGFYVNSSNNAIEEFEADNYAQNNLIPQDLWNDFILLNNEFSDEIIIDFANENKIHPGIVRGRLCHENPIFWKKRTAITKMNKLEV